MLFVILKGGGCENTHTFTFLYMNKLSLEGKTAIASEEGVCGQQQELGGFAFCPFASLKLKTHTIHLNFLFCFVFCPFAFSRATPVAYGGSQAGLIRAVATSLHHSHSNEGSEPHLRPTPQLTAMPDP